MKKYLIMMICLFMAGSLSGCGLFETMSGMSEKKEYSFSSMDELQNENVYVKKENPDKDGNQFFSCVLGDINFKGQETAEVSIEPRSIWIDEILDEKVPTLTSKDQLLYLSETLVPDEIVFERFADYGYSIGVSNLIQDGGNHYYFPYQDVKDDDYKYYVDLNSDAKQLIAFDSITKLYLDKVGAVRVDAKSVSDGGTVLGLEKGKEYTCEFYTGTYYQDFRLKADIHSFGSMERFLSHDYEFLHGNCIAIQIPDYFKSGYYFVNGIGLFRYVADKDEAGYNGEAYDSGIAWNDPIIVYDENGVVVEDPSREEEIKIESSSDPGEEGYDPNQEETEEIHGEEETENGSN